MQSAAGTHGRSPEASAPGPVGAVEDLAGLVEREVGTRGFVVVNDVIGQADCAALASAVDEAVHAETRWIGDRPDEFGRVLSLVHYGDPFDRVLGDDCILYTMSTGCLPPGGGPRPVHVDFGHSVGDDLLYLAAMVMLDDFTVVNGATRFLPDSCGSERPDERTFDDRSVAVEGSAGSICWFDPRLWHTSGTNMSHEWRRSILIGMVRRWMKPRFDHPAMLGPSGLGLPPVARRVLGYDSRPPATYEEFYGRSAAGGVASSAIHPTRSSMT